ncbi:lipid-binding SYLF domain-containing protein [Flavobacterium sp. MFBS3-15]|uniref:lipid-binding SYLF domain-containing protein n=1 Tax=Flavobacterium sp. MFBS3-15 TaxID=2989816 RepID=UPI002236B7F8|nr:lipid-binding SYLF domain-containing protein [Flavobacterium sp. MFBS3-15]MCW4467614.1 lipid-binding SYLF domain-containing protein [Flavobacterium sp. MFBS3-15]
MRTMKFWKLPLVMSAVFLLTAAVGPDKETERINESAEVLVDFSKMKESIPRELLDKCEGVVIIPKLLNAGLGIGGKRGKGVAMVKLADGKWSNPVFITMTGGSIGFQAGVQSVDLVLVFKNKGVLAKVNNGDFTIGGDASVTAGPVGRNSSASTDHNLEAEIYSYSRSRGAFAGISISGSNLGIDKSSNANFYVKGITPQTIFETEATTDEAVRNLKATLSSL